MEKHAIWHVKGWSLPYTPFELNFKIKYRDKTLYRQKKPINKIKRRIANWENIANFFFIDLSERKWLTPSCAPLTWGSSLKARNGTSYLSVHRTTLNQLRHTSQDTNIFVKGSTFLLLKEPLQMKIKISTL